MEQRAICALERLGYDWDSIEKAVKRDLDGKAAVAQ
jgi:hypothetical protein